MKKEDKPEIALYLFPDGIFLKDCLCDSDICPLRNNFPFTKIQEHDLDTTLCVTCGAYFRYVELSLGTVKTKNKSYVRKFYGWIVQ